MNEFFDEKSTLDDVILLLSQEKEPIRFLVAEDDETNKFYLETLLNKMNIKVMTATNGQEAFEIFSKESFDCVFMDIQMPVMDGITSSVMMRQYEEKVRVKKTTIVVLTALENNIDMIELNEAGINDYISKPVSAYELCYWVKDWYEKRKENLNIPSV